MGSTKSNCLDQNSFVVVFQEVIAKKRCPSAQAEACLDAYQVRCNDQPEPCIRCLDRLFQRVCRSALGLQMKVG